jgi:hypothetical protein
LSPSSVCFIVDESKTFGRVAQIHLVHQRV